MIFIKLEDIFKRYPRLARNGHASHFAREVQGGGQTRGILIKLIPISISSAVATELLL
jgi:hypothetical protein